MKKDSNTSQMAQTRDEKGRITGGKPPQGFQVNPGNISPGGWKSENTISFQYRRFLSMTPEQLKAFSKTPEAERTVAMDIAYGRILDSRKSLKDVIEITDRTEGKSQQSIDLTTGGEPMQALVIFEDGTDIDPAS